MNCPICLSVMYDSSPYLRYMVGSKRILELHCHNQNCKRVKDRPTIFGSYMEVLTLDPNPWECYSYQLLFEENKDFYYLAGGYDDLLGKWITTLSLSICKLNPKYDGSRNWHYDIDYKLITIVDFIKLSTDNDMHIKAWEAFNRLKKLSYIQ